MLCCILPCSHICQWLSSEMKGPEQLNVPFSISLCSLRQHLPIVGGLTSAVNEESKVHIIIVQQCLIKDANMRSHAVGLACTPTSMVVHEGIERVRHAAALSSWRFAEGDWQTSLLALSFICAGTALPVFFCRHPQQGRSRTTGRQLRAVPHGVYKGRCWVGVLQEEDPRTNCSCSYMDAVCWPQVWALPGLPQVLNLHG